MTLELSNVTIDCADVAAQARFWAAALGRTPADEASEFFVNLAGAPNWFLIKVPEGKTAKNRMHTDFVTDDREAEVARLVALGATKEADHHEFGFRWTVLHDPEGNEFCVADR